MITKKTVLVLGAGSSAHLDFPTGTKLKERVCNIPKDRNKYAPFYSFLNFKGISTEDVDRFFRDLQYSGKLSVDAFLEHQPTYTLIGKAAIASILIPFENKDKLFEKSDSWYGVLFKYMSTAFEEFPNNQISIITYNYDRSLEYFLVESLMHSYHRSRQEVTAVIKHIPIIHLHGDLGNPGYFTYLGTQDANCRSYDGTLDMPVLEFASRIKIIHESIDDDPEFIEAKKLLKDADIIAFLGFGYDKTNISRLNASEIPFLQFAAGKPVSIYGTAYGLGKAEVEWVESVIPRIKLGGTNEKINDILVNEQILIQPVSTEDLFHSKLGKTT